MGKIINRLFKLEKFRTDAKVFPRSLAWPLDTPSTFYLTIVNKLFIIDQ
jgi:hypothetical protein